MHLSQNIFKPRPCNLTHGYTWGSAENSKQLILHIHVAVYQSFLGRLLAPYFLGSTTTVMIPKHKLPRLEGYWDIIGVKFFRTRLLMGKLHILTTEESGFFTRSGLKFLLNFRSKGHNYYFVIVKKGIWIFFLFFLTVIRTIGQLKVIYTVVVLSIDVKFEKENNTCYHRLFLLNSLTTLPVKMWN